VIKLNGDVTDYPIPTLDCGVSIITPTVNGAYFTEYKANKIGFIDFAGEISEYPLEDGCNPFGVAVDDRQAVWFTCMMSNQIGRMSESKIDYFNIPTPVSYPSFITFGDDGSLWFCENQGNKIGRITKSGEITEFELPSHSSAPVGIATGADALWFAEIAGNRIGRIDYKGKFTEYEIPTASAKPHAIAVKNGVVAFTEWGANKIGVIVSSGIIQEFNIPLPHKEPHGIAIDEQGIIWFALESGAIGKTSLKPFHDLT
jgi:virginiamycin B lyase